MDEKTRKQLLAAYNASQHRYYQQQLIRTQALRAQYTRRMLCMAIISCALAWYFAYMVLPAILSEIQGLLAFIGFMLVG
jgi:hypothetical protein